MKINIHKHVLFIDSLTSKTARQKNQNEKKKKKKKQQQKTKQTPKQQTNKQWIFSINIGTRYGVSFRKRLFRFTLLNTDKNG